MSTAAPRSCLKPPIRNPWVADDGGESSTSSGQHPSQQSSQQGQHRPPNADHTAVSAAAGDGTIHTHLSHDLLAHQYATPYHSASHAPSVVSGARSTHGGLVHSHTGVVHSHTAHSLHNTGLTMPTAAHSVHSVPGTLQQPWVDPQMLWSTPALQTVGVGGGVFTVGGGGPNDGSCPTLPPGVYPQTHPVLHSLHSLHLGGGSSGQASSAGGPGAGQGVEWGPVGPVAVSYPQVHHVPTTSTVPVSGGRNFASSSENWSRCELCHYYCFRAAQAAFVAGIVTGFSLLVAGGVFHRKDIDHLQVLVYIGAMVSLVCVVLLVIFCAMNKDHRTRRGASSRFSGPQVASGDPETVPLRHLETNNPPIGIAESVVSHGSRVEIGGGGLLPPNDFALQTNHNSCVSPLPSQSSCMTVPPPTSHSVCYVPPASQGGGCIMGPNNQAMCFMGSTAHNTMSVMGTTKGMSSIPTSESHYATRHITQRGDDEASQRYNRLWKQPTKGSSEATSKL